ncbi:MAG: pyridoxamine 5'-phosphate oxidase family protein [Pseudomonadales bacterium]|nr:pyridoxamine 5'-phosphate oxidase family protein [Pseudomonadales bacterium]
MTTPKDPTLDNTPLTSPFHRGEQAVQSRLGVREKMERFGSRVIRDHMPEQHRDFYQQLPFVFVGHGDKTGWPWASILFNKPGFITSSNNQTLHINATPIAGDPLTHALEEKTRLGLLGIELTSRRRNRIAAHITEVSNNKITLSVDQAFGNCPQYIQDRELVRLPPSSITPPKVTKLASFDQHAQDLIKKSDTFFVASYANSGNDAVSDGADVSHRGGRPGFIRVDNENTLTIPDYLGNFHFNTLGNFVENPKAGLLFLDFETGNVFTVTGSVEIIWDDIKSDSPDAEFFEGAERLWKFHIDHGYWIQNGLSLRWKLNDFSPNSLLTGTWDDAKKLRQAEAQKNQWLPYTVTDVINESSVIKSFHLLPQGHQKPTFIPGQFLTIKSNINDHDQIRTYTISSAPADNMLRISIKRETSPNKSTSTESLPDGIFSNYAHDNIVAGDTILAKAPSGAFTFDASIQRPAVLLAAGIGITPMISMARHTLVEALRTRYIRPLTLITSARNTHQRAFFGELNDLVGKSGGQIRNFWALSQTNKTDIAGKDFHQQGRISAELLQAVLPLDDYDFYLCGPSGFMQSMYDMLRKLGVSDARIAAEEFGPASLTRDHDEATVTFTPRPSAKEAIIEFTDSNVEQAWSEGDGSLLELAEAHGFTPEFGCRSGQCGACKTKIISGEVSYQTEHSSVVNDGEVLLCCAVPAKVEGDDVARLAIKL